MKSNDDFCSLSSVTSRGTDCPAEGNDVADPKKVGIDDVMDSDSKEKYLRLNDFVQVLLENQRVEQNKLGYIFHVVKTLVQETDEVHIERTIQTICDF